MKRKLLCTALTCILVTALTGCGGSSADKTAGGVSSTGKTYKVGIVQFMDHASLDQITESIEARLDEKAKETGVSFNYKDYYFNGQGDDSVLSQAMSELKDDGVDIVIPIATPTVLKAQSVFEGSDTPIVFSAVTDPVGANLVASMDAPGGKITGTSDALNTDTVMDLIFANDPDADKIGLLYSTSEDSSTKAIADAKAYLDKKGVSYDEKTGTNSDEISMAADSLVADGVDAVFTPTDNTVMGAELSIYEKFTSAKIPHYAGADSFAVNGAFLGFGINYKDLGTKTADMAVDILVNGKDPATMPVEVLDSGIATINTETAEVLGIDIDKLKETFKPFTTDIVETKTSEKFEN